MTEPKQRATSWKNFDPLLCDHKVWSGWQFHHHQCARKRGHGKDGRFCWQHAKEKVKS